MQRQTKPWRDQAAEIKAMIRWRKSWYPQAPVYPVSLKPGGDPNAMTGLQRMSEEQIEMMQMVGTPPEAGKQVNWFLEGMLYHHGGALEMAHEALDRSSNTTIRRLSRDIILAQRKEIIQLRKRSSIMRCPSILFALLAYSGNGLLD